VHRELRPTRRDVRCTVERSADLRRGVPGGCE
jgi:hypothetical protein